MERNKSKAFLGLSILFFLVVTATAYYKENGLADVNRFNSEIEAVKKEIYLLQRENSRIRSELVSLNTSDSSVEAIAREQLGLVKPGEVVYEFINAETLANRNLAR